MAQLIRNKLGKFWVLLVLGAVSVSVFLFFENFSAKAQEQIKVLPSSFSGNWQNPEAAFSQDLGEQAPFEDFNIENSAHPLPSQIPEQELTTSTEETATTTEEIIEKSIEETTTTTNTTTTIETVKPSFLARLWTKLKNLFNSEVRAEESLCQDGSNRPCGNNIGVCQIGVQICQNGVWGKCIGSVDPSPEICDGVDNDCDGQIDEGVICGGKAQSSTCQHGSNRPCSSNVGACQIGVQICEQGVWGKCIGARMPSQEICDGVDNDCDGEVDERGVCEGQTTPAEAEPPQGGKVLILSDFGVTPPQNTKIKLVQLRMSLAGKGEIGDKLIIEYSYYNNAWQSLAEFNLENEISNALNGGYFLYGLPIFENREDLENLKIRFIYQGQTSSRVYLDSIWLEVETEEVTGEELKTFGEERFSLKSIKKDWRGDEEPEFELEEMPKGFWAKIGSVFEKKEKSVVLIDPGGGEVPGGAVIQGNKIKITKPDEENFRPGLYKLKIKIVEGGEEFIQEQEFSWGVLAINFNKSIYLTPSAGSGQENETAYIQMGVLDDKGHTICDAELGLRITNQNLGIEVVLSTADGTIQYSGECAVNNVTDVPDYFAYFQVAGAGTYQVKLMATTINGVREITDQFEVRVQAPFDVERIGPTRIYPPATYEMKFKIKVNQDFVGQVIETVPESFEVIPHETTQIRTQNNTKEIIWQVAWQAGEEHELRYQFDAPDVSPYLYLLGPLEFMEDENGSRPIFKETRRWQIAADAMTTVILTAGTSWTVPNEWNNASNTIEVIGGGGGGGDGTNSGPGGAGGGGYSKVINLTLSGTVTYSVGAAGVGATVVGGAGTDGGNTWFNANSFALCTDPALCTKAEGGKGSLGGTNMTGGAGGLNTNGVGTTKYSGGIGGLGCTDDGAGGGGGAAGPLGTGGKGGTGGGDTSPGLGGGGGGNGGGSQGQDVACSSVPTVGGAGGNNQGGTGGGAGGTSASTAGGAGTVGGGGGGSYEAGAGGVGGPGIEWDSTHGSGGGGGGGGDLGKGGAGNNYGGGGGAGEGNGGNGGQGIIVIRYSPSTTTVAATGNQTLSMNAGDNDRYVGGAFTFQRDSDPSSRNVTSIKITETDGTFDADANLTDVKLYYEAGDCDYTNGGYTQFGSAGSFSSQAATFSGTMAVGASQICVYVVLDVAASAPSGSFDIAINTASDVLISYGTIGGTFAVTINGSTQITAANQPPTLASAAESPLASTSTSPINTGNQAVFGGTGDDPNSEDYYLIVCPTNTCTAVNNSAPTCGVGNAKYCVSGATTDNNPTSCSTTTNATDFTNQTYDWYMCACDGNSTDAKCSSASQGSGDSGSPFHVNHRPTFTAVGDDTSGNPGASDFTVTATTYNDTDGAAYGGTQDQVKLYVCKTNSFSTSTNNGCDTNQVWCTSTDWITPTATLSCDLTIPSPASHGTNNQTYYPFIKDSHNFAASDGAHGVVDYYSVNDVAPTVGSVKLHDGNDITIPIKPNTVIVTTTSAVVRDYNGCDDIVSATSTIYISSYGNWGSCASSSLDCYNLGTTECGKSACDGIGTDLTATYTCTTSMQHWTNPTDGDGSNGNPWWSYHWIGMITAKDGWPNYGSGTSTVAIETNTQLALDVTEPSIAYGTLYVGQNTGSINSTTTIVNYGNSPLDATIYAVKTLIKNGTDWTALIATSSQAYSLSPFTYGGGNLAVLQGSATATNTDIVCAKPTSDTDVSAKVSWGLGVPLGTQAVSYLGTNGFTATLDSDAWPSP